MRPGGTARVSDLMRGRITLFGRDTLVNMVAAFGRHVAETASRSASPYAQRPPFNPRTPPSFPR